MMGMNGAFANIYATGRLVQAEIDAFDQAAVAAISCKQCRPVAFKEFRTFEINLKKALQDSIDQVRV